MRCSQGHRTAIAKVVADHRLGNVMRSGTGTATAATEVETVTDGGSPFGDGDHIGREGFTSAERTAERCLRGDRHRGVQRAEFR